MSDTCFRLGVLNVPHAIRGEEEFLTTYKEFIRVFRLKPVTSVKKTEDNSVWLLARPLSHALRIPVLAASSAGKFPLSHWGILVTDLSLEDISMTLRDIGFSMATEHQPLGNLFELNQCPNGTNTLNTTSPFRQKDLRAHWPMASFKYVGKTLDSKTQIEQKCWLPLMKWEADSLGVDILSAHPNYKLFTNNCQNFAKYLIEEICNVPLTVETIEQVLNNLYDPKNREQPPLYFPGSYPHSMSAPSESGEFITAFSTSLKTACETSFHTPCSIGSADSVSVELQNGSLLSFETDINGNSRSSIHIDISLC